MLTAVSHVTFTTVRHISRILSTPMMRAAPGTSSGFICSNTTNSITIPAQGTAADPIEASVAVATIVICCHIVRSNQKACAINTAATA